MLEVVARKLGDLNDRVVYLGGCTTVLFINDPLSLDVRPTLNVDCLVDVVSLGEYYNFEKELNKRGHVAPLRWSFQQKRCYCSFACNDQ